MTRNLLILLTIAMMTAAIGCGKDKLPRLALPPEEVTIATADSAAIAATWRAVEGANVTVICIPTVGGFTKGTWRQTASELNAVGWSVLSIDLRDQGGSSPPPGTDWRWSVLDTGTAIANYTLDVGAAIEWTRTKTGGRGDVVLVGADIGGIAALYAAALEPTVDGVTLVAPPGGLSHLVAEGLVSRYGDRPLLVMTELPIEATVGTARTLDSWLGRGSAITMRLSAPHTSTTIGNKRAALETLIDWIRRTAR